MDAKQLAKEREQIYLDLFTNKIPKRFPVEDGLSWNYLIEYAGEDLMLTQFTCTKEKAIEIAEKGMEILRGDRMFPLGGLNPVSLMFQKSRQSVMSSSGMIQHPEVEYMYEDEYDDFIKKPYDFVLERIIPRCNPAYAQGEVLCSFAFARYLLSAYEKAKEYAAASEYIREKYGLHAPPPGSGAHQYVPFDFLADHCRGFSKIHIDIKRQPEKVLEALEALVPFCMWTGENKVQSPLGSNLLPTHMGPYLNMRDFEKFYWPTFEKVVHLTAARGQTMLIFLENDWTRFLDYLQELPAGTRLFMEYGDPKKFKEKLGKKMVLAGFYPITLLRTGTKQQCIDKAKELIDILAPGGNYYFCFDKTALRLSDVNPENYVAVMEYVLENSYYDNAGEPASSIKWEDTIKNYTYPEFKSKYVINFDEYIKDYPPVDPRIEPFMREGYLKYSDMLFLRIPHAM